MNLKKGIMIHNQLPNGYDAITINSGTVFHTEQVTDKVDYETYQFTPQYEENAYVPKRDWRQLNQKEINCLQSDNKRNTYNTIYLGEIPENLKVLFQNLALSDCKSRAEVVDKFGKNLQHTQVLSEEMNRFLTPFAAEKPFRFHCLGINLPNIEMVACNTTKLPLNFEEQDKRLMGIHNDGTEHMTLYTAHKFGNRISINLSNEARYFLFANISMIQALNMLKEKIDIKAYDINIVNVPSYFFKYYPNYPVVKIVQQPYQYYIAPTDNCFHDGSTLGNKELDISIIYFGRFQS